MSKEITENGWAIHGRHGLYVGWKMSRREMIEEHCKRFGRDWKYLKETGDKPVKIKITYKLTEG